MYAWWIDYLLTGKPMMKKETNQANRHGHISEERQTPPQEEPRAGPSGVPEEATATTGNDSSMCYWP